MALRKPGHFATLLRVRKRQENRQSAMLGHVRKVIAHAQEDRQAIAHQQQAALDKAGQLARKRFDAADVRRFYQYERYLARRADEKDAEIQKLTQEEAQERAKLEDAMKHRRMAEHLEDHVANTYAGHVRKFEQQQSDEVASNYHTRGIPRAGGGG
ncbi:MAG: hypothetical protein ACLFTT_13755 [Candidatus Hydrogenedentota bacterium]